MRRHMELHADGLERVGVRASLFFAEDLRAWSGLSRLRMSGAGTVMALHQRLGKDAPDIVNVHTQCAPAWIAAREAGIVSAKIVVMSYAAEEPQINWRGPRDALRWANAALPARWSFPRANGIWCVNQQDAEYYAEEYGVARARIGRFPHAVADSFYRAGRSSLRNPRQLLFVGTWIRRKGVDVLARALEQVIADVPDVSIVLAGTLSGEANVRAALGPATRERARILDRASDEELRALYDESALLLLPSRREGLPIVMLEALARGCPPLAAANSGMLDAIEPGRNGWLEVSFDGERWAERIVQLLRQPEALALASAGAQASAEAYRIERVAREVVAWYSRLTS
jgi:glycosyltransferase involved in cell wall biosynthesis